MRLLFIGGNGNISWYCVQKCLDAGHEVWELNRGMTRKTRRPVQPDVHQILCDIRNVEETKKILFDMKFDAVCDFICFNETDAAAAIDIFRNKTKQYIYISSEAVYKRTANCFPLSEGSELYSTVEAEGYIKGKIMAERVFLKEYKENGFPVTVVRPGYTYDTIMPVSLGYNCFTVAKKLLEGYPLLILGDGTNLWAPLHSEDFAGAFIHLVGNESVIGDFFNIVSDQYVSLNDMGRMMISALGIERDIINIKKDIALSLDIIKDREIAYQHMSDYVFDSSKIMSFAQWKPVIDFENGIGRTVSWFLESKDHQRITEKLYNSLTAIYKTIL